MPAKFDEPLLKRPQDLIGTYIYYNEPIGMVILHDGQGRNTLMLSESEGAMIDFVRRYKPRNSATLHISPPGYTKLQEEDLAQFVEIVRKNNLEIHLLYPQKDKPQRAAIGRVYLIEETKA